MQKGGVFLELSQRKKAILSAIVKLHIASGEPIGSKILCDILENAPSSATLRNEMSALCDMGFLSQPHTSAGRVPTALGYKLYVESLMNRDAVNPEHKQYIDSVLSPSNCDPEKMPDAACKVLSEITGLPSLVANISANGPAVKRVELFKMGNRSAMLILITTDGRSRSRLVSIPTVMDADLVAKFDKLVTARILKKRTEELSPAAQQNIYIAAGMDALPLMPLLSSLFDMISDINNTNVSMAGQTKLFTLGLGKADADKIISLLGSRDTLMSILADDVSPVGVIFGRDTVYSVLHPSSIIFAKYNAGEKNTGCVGVIGPTRMSYEQIIPSIEYTAKRMDSLLTATFKDMEEF